MNALRPKLTNFRVTEFSSLPGDFVKRDQLDVQLHQEISFALSTPEFSVPLHAAVMITFHTEFRAVEETNNPRFVGTYIATFQFSAETTLDEANLWLADEPHQYSIVSQAFPMAMMHFKREMLEAGFDARALPVGI